MVANKKVMTGARAIIYIDSVAVGMFESCTYSSSMRTEPAYILGRFTAAQIVPTSMEVINLNCSGFRIFDEGVHVLPKVPKLQDLLNLQGVTISVTDRSNPTLSLLTATDCFPISYSGGFQAQATSKISIVYQGIKIEDESGAQDEVGASSLPVV